MPLHGPWSEEFERIKQHTLDQIAQVDPYPPIEGELHFGDLIPILNQLVVELNFLNASLTRLVDDFLEVPPNGG